MQLETPLDEVFDNGANVRVLRALAALPDGLAASARDIARRAGVAHTTAGRVLRRLAELRIVHAQRAGRADLYQLNRRHELATQIRDLFGSEAGLRARLIDYLRAEIPRRLGPAEDAFLFGSAARAATRPRSDVDVAVIAPERSEPAMESGLAALSDAVRERFGSELNVIVAPDVRGRRGRSPLWQRIEREGLPLLSKRVRRG